LGSVLVPKVQVQLKLKRVGGLRERRGDTRRSSAGAQVVAISPSGAGHSAAGTAVDGDDAAVRCDTRLVRDTARLDAVHNNRGRHGIAAIAAAHNSKADAETRGVVRAPEHQHAVGFLPSQPPRVR